MYEKIGDGSQETEVSAGVPQADGADKELPTHHPRRIGRTKGAEPLLPTDHYGVCNSAPVALINLDQDTF
jgi:hypothetical protein